MATKVESGYIIRLEKIKRGKGGLLGALRHNKRQLPPEPHIDQSRTPLNYSLLGSESPDAIDKHAKKQMIDANISLRKNAVVAVEIIFSLPIYWHEKDSTHFFKDCFEWTCRNLPGEALAFDVHLDESAPHAHALILPLINGRMKGSDMVGGTGNLMRLIKLFYAEVAIHYGLGHFNCKRLTTNQRKSIEQLVLNRLKDDSIVKSKVWTLVRDNIRKNPQPYAELLSISNPVSLPKKSFVDCMRSQGRGSFVK